MGPMGAMLGAKGKSMPMDGDEESGGYEEPEMGEEEAPADDVPPDFSTLYDEYSNAPSAKGLYDLIEACKGGGEKPGGLALILGGKGKK